MNRIGKRQTGPTRPKVPDIKTIRSAIPDHCFVPSTWYSLYFVARDISVVIGLGYTALHLIPLIPSPAGRLLAWMVYGYCQGLFGTGMWILGHEAGHGAFSVHPILNDCVGWALHSMLLVPYFSWKFSHHRHHRFAGHIEKDMAFVPSTQPKQSTSPSAGNAWFTSLGELLEDAPVFQLLQLLLHQLFGWQSYLFFNASAGEGSLQREEKGLGSWLRVSHFDPHSAVFRPSEAKYVFISDIGILVTLAAIYFGAKELGWSTMFLLYGVPYFWVHHWLVAITYLHHNDPNVPHFTKEGWTFVDGAVSTIDREFGFIGKHIFHGIIEKHVVHHLFPRIPFYKADEATEAIKPVLGSLYIYDNRSFLGQLWSVFSRCKYVVDDPTRPGALKWADQSN